MTHIIGRLALGLLLVGLVNAQTRQWFVMKVPQIVKHKCEPQYSAAAWADQLVANGAVDVSVDEHGFPTMVRLVSWQNLNGGGDARGLDQATVAAVRQWRFHPLLVESKFLPFTVRVGFVVRPEGSTYTTSRPEPETP